MCAHVARQHPLRWWWHLHRAAFNGGMSRRARASVNEATTLAKTVHRWQACRARPRCASTPTGKCCNTPCQRLHACRSSIHSPTDTCIRLAMLMHGGTAMAAGRPAHGRGWPAAAPSWPGGPTPLTLSHPRLTAHPTGSTGGLREAVGAARHSYVHPPRDADARRHVGAQPKVSRLHTSVTDGRAVGHDLDAPPRQLASAATRRVNVCTRVAAASTHPVTRASSGLQRWHVEACTCVGERSHHAC